MKLNQIKPKERTRKEPERTPPNLWRFYYVYIMELLRIKEEDTKQPTRATKRRKIIYFIKFLCFVPVCAYYVR